jgi:hypothetical protein
MDERTPEDRIAMLLRELPPAPAGWVEAAAALPEARKALEHFDASLLAGDRAQVTAALERALRDADVTPTPERLDAMRRLVETIPREP